MVSLTIKIVSFYAFQLEKGEQVYLININPASLNFSPTISVNSVTSEEELTVCRCEALANLPSEYHDFAESVFREKSAHFLPPYRIHFDHHIDPVDEFNPVFSPIYNLFETEL